MRRRGRHDRRRRAGYRHAAIAGDAIRVKTLARAALAAGLAAAGAAPCRAAAPPDYDTVVKTYFDQDAAAHPVNATALGLHRGDTALDDSSAAARAAEVRRLHATLDQLAAVDAAKLTLAQRDDREVLTAEIGRALLEDEHIQAWRHNPDIYVGLATQAAYTLVARNFAPAQVRMAAVAARERLIPAMFATAKLNLVAMPPVFVDIGLENVAGAIDFFGRDVPAAFAGVSDKKAQAALAATTQATLAAARDFQAWLQVQKKTSHGSFVLGSDNFRRLLAADLIDTPADTVLAAGRAQLKRDQDAFAATSRQVAPQAPASAIAILGRDHPDAARLVPTARDMLASLRAFIVAHKIVDLPGTDLPIVADTPKFQRALIVAEMDAPGPFETVATQAYYYITPPEAASAPAVQNEYLEYFNRPFLLNLAVHEALPGHFTQFLYLRAHPEWSIVRKTAQSYTTTEGWAHYSEQMMQEQGVGGGTEKLRLAQLQDALLRDCRLIASVEMHTHGMSLADATKLMTEQCFQPKDVAYKEARRGTADPGYYSYMLGKLMIEKLRADVQAREGHAFTLAHFHDRFLGAGLVPVKIIRREITGADGPLL
jgi:hypothetical protein